MTYVTSNIQKEYNSTSKQLEPIGFKKLYDLL